ncbi:IS66 family insertion sequence element accessory protein TnpB [Cellulosilyticum ruminicola]|uniref:IS66 family insertion sequence element accessory protein TnpB n=1 Tax=Cellulosilyticum ruminicola TaxID=425254 RepID=UPI0038B7CEC5
MYIACGHTDLRLGIDRLSCLIQEQFHLDPFKPYILFMFCGKRADRIKCLL